MTQGRVKVTDHRLVRARLQRLGRVSQAQTLARRRELTAACAGRGQWRMVADTNGKYIRE